MSARTVVIGDIHGDAAGLDRLLARIPALGPQDTLVFLGDYVDRGPSPKTVVERVRGLVAGATHRIVTLRGNHEDKWARSFEKPDPTFLLPVGNGCANTFRSYIGGPPVDIEVGLTTDEMLHFLDVPTWFPPDVAAWFDGLPLYHEDEHAIYVHAGLDGDTGAWKHPSVSAPQPLLWMRDPAFFKGYAGKRVVFGHTITHDLPTDHLGTFQRLFDDPADVWFRGDLIGLDTGAGKDGYLSAIELPSLELFSSR